MMTLKVKFWMHIPAEVFVTPGDAQSVGSTVAHESTQWITDVIECTVLVRGRLDSMDTYMETTGLFASGNTYRVIGSDNPAEGLDEKTYTLVELETARGTEYVVVGTAFLLSETGATIDRIAP